MASKSTKRRAGNCRNSACDFKYLSAAAMAISPASSVFCESFGREGLIRLFLSELATVFSVTSISRFAVAWGAACASSLKANATWAKNVYGLGCARLFFPARPRFILRCCFNVSRIVAALVSLLLLRIQTSKVDSLDEWRSRFVSSEVAGKPTPQQFG